MVQGRCCHSASVADMCYGKIDGLPTTELRREPRCAVEQSFGAIALLAGRQLADVASSAMLVMRGLPSQLQRDSVARCSCLERASWSCHVQHDRSPSL